MLDSSVEQRILAALSFQEADRVPIWDLIDNRAVVDHLCPGWTDPGDAMSRLYEIFGIDMCRGYATTFAQSDNGTVTYSDDVVETRVSGQSNWTTRRRIKTLEDLAAYDPQPADENELRNDWIDRNRSEMERFEPHTMWIPSGGCGFHSTYGVMGQQFFAYAIYDDPANVERILEIETENAFRRAKAAAEAALAPVYFIGDDIAYKGALMFSPEFLRRTFIKSLRKCIEPVKAAGLKVIFHSDGYVMEILDDMIDAGIDGLNPIEPIAGMDIGLLKRRYGKNLVLVGNVDCSQVLPLGSVDDVVEATKQCLREAGQGGGLLIGSSSEIVPCTPVENIIAFYEACRTWGTYPLRV